MDVWSISAALGLILFWGGMPWWVRWLRRTLEKP